jgi:PEGA domain
VAIAWLIRFSGNLLLRKNIELNRVVIANSWRSRGASMSKRNFREYFVLSSLVLFLLAAGAFAENKVLGEVELQGASKLERDSGVWVDGQYLGYLKELKGDKKVLLLPGEHEIVVRQDGYEDFRTTVTLQPAEKVLVAVKLTKDMRFKMPSVFSDIKMDVNPNRAAVFVDDLFVGHAADFDGLAHSLRVAPGHRKITISLPGYQTFNTEVDLLPNQQFRLKTKLLKAPAALATSASN